MNSEDLIRLESEMGVLTRRVRRALAERARMLHPALLSSEYSVCVFLHQHGPQRASTLVEAFGTDKGAMSRQISRLEELGLVARQPDPTDGRAHLVRLTDETAARHEEIARLRRDRLAEVLSDWSGDDLRHFIDDLSRYNATLERGTAH